MASSVSGQARDEPSNGIQAEQNLLINLYDHRTSEASDDAIPDWGYAAFIRYNGHTILFDGGTSAVILEHNAKALGLDLTEIDVVVLSHSHGDHTVGISHVLEVNPSVTIYVPFDWGFASFDTTTDRKYRKGHRWQVDDYHTVKETTEIVPGVTLIHTTSSLTGVYWKYPPYEEEPLLFPLVELSLALTTESGDVFLELARLMRDQLGVKRAAGTHCTGEAAIEILKETFGDNYVWGGLGARIEFPE
jgi:7,8-dihydropterin-6-yl-methyl-4-(beta-D-ribofuranosyl)aminobenzene 5'-phosphate synthase